MNSEPEIKLCGTTSMHDLNVAMRVGADIVGIICRPENMSGQSRSSIRSHTLDVPDAVRLRHQAKVFGLDVAVLPRTDDFEETIELVDAIEPDILQISQVEDAGLTRALSDKLGPELEIAQVIHIGDETKDITPFLDFVDIIHFDSDGSLPGGNDVTHNWEISCDLARQAHEADKLVALAGGLTADNVDIAIDKVRPDMIDVESGIKGGFGMHSHILARKLVESVRDEMIR